MCETQGRPGQCRKEEQERTLDWESEVGIPAWAPAGLGALLTEAALPDLIPRVSAGLGGGLVDEEEKTRSFERAAQTPALGSDPITDGAMSLPLRGHDMVRTKWYGTKCHPQLVARPAPCPSGLGPRAGVSCLPDSTAVNFVMVRSTPCIPAVHFVTNCPVAADSLLSEGTKEDKRGGGLGPRLHHKGMPGQAACSQGSGALDLSRTVDASTYHHHQCPAPSHLHCQPTSTILSTPRPTPPPPSASLPLSSHTFLLTSSPPPAPLPSPPQTELLSVSPALPPGELEVSLSHYT